jgi:hypothetical protein
METANTSINDYYFIFGLVGTIFSIIALIWSSYTFFKSFKKDNHQPIDNYNDAIHSKQ